MNKKTIHITGDIAIDHILVTGSRKNFDSIERNGANVIIRKGGSYMIYKFLSKISDIEDSGIEKLSFGFKDGVFNAVPAKFNSYLKISEFSSSKNGSGEKKWKVSELFGFGDLSSGFQYNKDHINQETAQVLVVDDASMDFSSSINENAWPSFLTNLKDSEKPQLIVYKISGAMGRGELWGTIASKYANRLVSVISIHDLRRGFLKVSKGISWEQTAMDLVKEISSNKHSSVLLKSHLLIITFGSSGAVIIERSGKGKAAEYNHQLIFDPRNLEDEWEASQSHKGTIIGNLAAFTSMFTATLSVKEQNKKLEIKNIENAVKAGLTAIRVFFNTGYKDEGESEFDIPYKEISEIFNKKVFDYSNAFIPTPGSFNRKSVSRGEKPEIIDWSILTNNLKPVEKINPLYNVARRVAKYGISEFTNIPHASFGNLYSADRNEIENFRNVKKIIENYVNHDSGKKPLSIGVFGPPGSGKSFSVEQISLAVMGKDVDFIEFNLSQFDGSEDLIGAFHKVRDSVLKKNIPVVFWDEFDSRGYEWLQYLLAPMQDGRFQEGQLSHPIGKCIFIFAGGTSYTMENFGPVEPKNPKKCADLTDAEKKVFNQSHYDSLLKKYDEDVLNFKLKKGPDFKSRLNAYLNVLGPNQREYFDRCRSSWLPDETDVFYPIRRALFIRALLKTFGDAELQMEWGLINAFLKTKRFEHGARSLTQIIDQIKSNNSDDVISRSSLPSSDILSMHVDIDDFESILDEDIEFLGKSQLIAPNIHYFWLAEEIKRDPDSKSIYKREFEMLSSFGKETNYAAASRIPIVLAEAGLVVRDKSNSFNLLTKQEFEQHLNQQALNKEVTNLEVMAEKEHDLWMQFHFDHGWEYNKVRNNAKKQHNLIMPYEDLDQTNKDKDRNSVENYFEYLDEAGFGISKED